MPILPSFKPTSRAAALAALLLTAAVPACGGAGGSDKGAEYASDFGDAGSDDGPARVEVDPCALLTHAEMSEQLARAISPSERSGWSTLEFDITPTEVPWGISRRCEYKFQSLAMVGGTPAWRSDFSVMVIHAMGIAPEDKRQPVAGAPEIFRESQTKSYYITRGAHAATLTSFPGSREGDDSEEDATRIALLRRIAERLP